MRAWSIENTIFKLELEVTEVIATLGVVLIERRSQNLYEIVAN